jgi:hypothetical protein
MTATVGGGPSFGSQAAETESIERPELRDPQENMNRSRGKVMGSVKRRFLVKDKDVPLV